ncbi:hypothetical protein [Aquimarina spongiae]|uniref:MG2 domain-containing protein n=1 Tax=Aquimarina spongiae TaxID=570521 RepID=A0A1M6FB60_9FLAO|nr:hypothetical protein [Aquimarina spongiae]SHI94984.1 hypothetical protein SAMN04488508_104189 [Aquimarina spongiae]
MKNHLFQFLALLFISLPVFAQGGDIVTVEEANASYFEVPRETLYLHVNKSTYVTGEEIWFKGYAYDRQNNLPSINTTNFEVEIFDEQGNEVYDGVFIGSNGSFQGNIKVDSTWSSGTYFMRTSTHWMHNFVEDETYTKKIRIIKDELPEVVTSENTQYDFQLLPEGGHVVANTFNTIGFKLINDQGYGITFDRGVIQDELGNEVTTFSSNALGLGKFNIAPRLGKTYRALIKLKDGREIEGKFPQIEKKGVSISINNLIDEELAVELNTNTATIKELIKDNYAILIRNDHLSKKVKVRFKAKELKKKLSIKRSDLYEGMNILTLFKEDMPVLERLVFNPINIQDDGIKVSTYSTTTDSLMVEVAAPSWDHAYDLSVSVLPSETKAYAHTDNIHSAMLLRPYIKGFIENEKRYFTNVDRDKIYDLDLLLITQGWSKYKWKNIFNSSPKVKYNFNQGFRITGKIQDRKREEVDNVYLYPTINNGAKLVEVNQDNTFEIDNFFPQKGEKLRISGIKTKGDFKKSGLYLQVQSDRIHRPFFNTFPVADKQYTQKIQNKVVVPYNFLSDVQELETVELKGSSQKELERTSSIQIPKFFELNSKKITLEKAEQYYSILDYIQSTGKFNVQRDNASFVRILTRRGTTISLPVGQAPPIGVGTGVNVYLDDFLLADLGILWDLRTADVDRIYTDFIGYGAGARGAGPTIRLYTRRYPLVRTHDGDKNYLEYEFTKGFEPTKEFYNPGYTNYKDPFFVNYGAIHWQPRLHFDNTGTAVFKIPNTGLENITLHLEGMMSDGSLISKTHKIK